MNKLRLAGAITLALTLCCSLQAVTTSHGTYHEDKAGDTRGNHSADAYFDIISSSIETQGTDTLRFTIETKEPIPERPENKRTWIGLYIDLDKDADTGLPGNLMGTDFIATIDSIPDGKEYKWEASFATPSPIGRKYNFTSTLISKEGNRFTIEVTSPQAFIDYPQFVIQMHAQKEGIWLDLVDDLGSLPITLFPVSDAAINYTESTQMRRTLVATAGHIRRVHLPANNKTKEIRCELEIKSANKKGNYTNYVRINLKDRTKKDIVKFRLANSKERKKKAVVRIYNRSESEGPYYLKNFNNPNFIGKHVMVLRLLEDGIAEFEIDGRVLERQKIRFNIDSAEIRAGSCTAIADISVK